MNKKMFRCSSKFLHPKRCLLFAIALQSLALSGCGGDNNKPRENIIEVTSGPTLTMNPTGAAPLAGIVELQTDMAAGIILTVDDTNVARAIEFPGSVVAHTLPVLGLKPNTTYTVTVTLVDENGIEKDVDPPLSLTTDPLPAAFPDIQVAVSEPDQMEPGYTMLSRLLQGQGQSSPFPLYTIILDADGDVVWYSDLGNILIELLPNGHLQFLEGTDLYEVDMLGNEISVVTMQDPGTNLHHEFYHTTRDTYLGISRVNATVDNYPINHTDPLLRQTTEVIDEPIVEFSPTGEVIEMWSMVDLLDTTRTNYAGISEDGPPHDWIHTNAVIEDPSDDSIIISMRHQDAVVKFDRATGSLVWILGPHENWSPAFQPFLLDPVDPNLQWQFHQHAPMITAEGTLMIFDNGNEKASPYDGRPQVADEDNDTRAVEYSIDEANMTVSEVWEFGSQAVPRLFAPFIGDADTLPGTGNVLITFGGTRFIDGVASTDLGYGGVVARITEVTRETPAEKVFDVMLTHDTGWVAVYRSDRIPTLYAEDVTVTTTN